MTHNSQFASPEEVMRHAIEIARRGIGAVEPNPAVGAVVVDSQLANLAEGWHERFGGPHAEVNALRNLEAAIPDSNERMAVVADATLYVTLEPCCHQGQTPPCTQAIIESGLKRVVYAHGDPSPHVDGGGHVLLHEAGIDVSAGLIETEAAALLAPFLKRVRTGMPWVHAKWAMTLDGRIAARTGASQWISNETSRSIVHELRGRMDAIVVGSNTARIDDPLLTARPAGHRTPTRIVIDSSGTLSPECQLVRTVNEAPVLVAVGASPDSRNVELLRNAGVEVVAMDDGNGHVEVRGLLLELGERQMTNVLVEGGGGLLGAIFDQQLADELHVFVAPKIVGGADAYSPVGGTGLDAIPHDGLAGAVEVMDCDGDVYIHGFVRQP